MTSVDGWTLGATYEDIFWFDIVMKDIARMDMTKSVKHLIYHDLGFSRSESHLYVLLFQVSQSSQSHSHPSEIFAAVNVLNNGRL